MTYWVQDNFSKNAQALRKCFDSRFEDPKKTNSNRFVWDFWHVPDQYTLMRTPAEYFFPKKLYQSFLNELGVWAQETLGCNAITSPWLSYYINGCEQKLHSDIPHGPWAFVFSLCPKKLNFTGGETLLLRPELLDYWKNFRNSEDRELSSFVRRISPKFNRLIVFDPRIPHGVTTVQGIMDPRQARLVLHGWFTDPKPYIRGSLPASRISDLLNESVEEINRGIGAFGEWHGVLSLRLRISPVGKARVSILANTLQCTKGLGCSKGRLHSILKGSLEKKFPKSKGITAVTLPLLFR